MIGVLVDLTRMKLAFLRNGSMLGEAFSLPEAVRDTGVIPHVGLKNARLEINGTSKRAFHEFDSEIYILASSSTPRRFH